MDCCGRSRSTKCYKSLPYNPNLVKRAKELRKYGNLSEAILWMRLKSGHIDGVDFDRQKVIGNYIVDFFSPDCGLVVEIDGCSHDGKGKYDEEREQFLKSLELEVIHFSDVAVKNDVDEVVRVIYDCVNLLGDCAKTTPSG